MRIGVFGLFIFTILNVTEVGLAVPIYREQGGSLLVFEGGEDLLKIHGEKGFEQNWLKKDSTYRGDCYVQTLPFEIPFQANVDLIVHYEAKWRDAVDDVSELSEIELARFDIAYEKSNGSFYRESQFLVVADLGKLNWHAKSMDFTYVSAATEKPKKIHFKTATIPNGSKNIRAKMCGVGPSTSIRVSRIEMRLSEYQDAMTVSDFNSHDILYWHDTGLLQKVTLPDIKFLRIYAHSLIKQLSNWKDVERGFSKASHHSELLHSQALTVLNQLSSTALMAREDAEELEDQSELRHVKEKEAERLENAHRRLSEALDADQVCKEAQCNSNSPQELSALISSEGQAVRAELEALDKFLKSEIERLENVEATLIKQLNALRRELLKILSKNQ